MELIYNNVLLKFSTLYVHVCSVTYGLVYNCIDMVIHVDIFA